MITRNTIYTSTCCVSEMYGLSTDTKPTDVCNSSTFMEMDTGLVFIFDEENQTWHSL